MSKDYEKTGIKISIYGSLLLSLSAIIMALIARSQAILLDGLYTFMTLMMSFMALKVVDLVKTPEKPSAPFGYMALEPFTNLIKSFAILSLLIVFLVTNVQKLMTGGRYISLNVTTLYMCICVLIYIIIIALLRTYNKKVRSSLLSLEMKNWVIDACMTVGILISLFAAMLSMRLGYTQILPYIDPTIVIVLALLSLPVPLKVCITELKRVLLVSPENDLTQEVIRHLTEVIQHYGLINIHVWSLKSGRTLYFFIYSDLENEHTSIAQLDDIRSAIFHSLAKHYSHFWADIIFTRINPEKPFPFTSKTMPKMV